MKAPLPTGIVPVEVLHGSVELDPGQMLQRHQGDAPAAIALLQRNETRRQCRAGGARRLRAGDHMDWITTSPEDIRLTDWSKFCQKARKLPALLKVDQGP